jgi:hypothetical protein
MNNLSLAPEHHVDLIKSGLNPETCDEANIQIITPYEASDMLRLTLSPAVIECLKIPYFSLNGEMLNSYFRIKLIPYGLDKDGNEFKYLQPKGEKPRFYLPPLNDWSNISKDTSIPMYIVEGEKKALAATQAGLTAIGISGVWSWCYKDKNGASVPIDDFGNIEWKNRKVYIVGDSDLWREDKIQAFLGLYALAKELHFLGADIELIKLNDINLEKVGFDDFYVHHKDGWKCKFEKLKTYKLKSKSPCLKLVKNKYKLWWKRRDSKQKHDDYLIIDSSIYRENRTETGSVIVRLTNFVARVTEDIKKDDGKDVDRYYNIEVEFEGKQLPKISIKAKDFPNLGWINEKYGVRPIIYPPNNNKDYVRHAIQTFSNGAIEEKVFTHTGWREVDGEYIYLTAAGAIGDADISVELPKELQRYSLPLDIKDEAKAIKTSLSFLGIGKREITIPSLAYCYLAPLTTLLSTQPNFSLFINGETGTFKTTVSCLLMSHYGLFDSAENLTNFNDTANAIERRAFILKDTPMLLDDFHPSYGQKDSFTMSSTLQRIIRNYGNRTARGRLNSDSTEKGRYEPRGLLIVTGEDLPTIQSTVARTLILEIAGGDIDKKELTNLQRGADMLPHAMATYISWIKGKIPEIKKGFKDTFREYRQKALKEGCHMRLPEQVAFLQYGLDLFIQFLVEKKIMSEDAARELSEEGWGVFTALAASLKVRVEQECPVARFIDILDTLITQKRVSLDFKASGNPIGGSDNLIGYYDIDYYYLMSTPLFNAIKKFCREEGSHFPLTRNTLYSMLRKRNLIETDYDRNTVSVYFKGTTRKRVLKLKRSYENEEG